MEHHPTSPGVAPTALILLALGAVLALYLLSAFRAGGASRPWSRWRALSFTAGIALLAIAFSPPLDELAHRDLRGHMGQHLLIGMFAPVGLALGAPMTLALRTVPVGVARFITSILASWPFRLLSHPVTALVLNIGGMALLYFTPLFASTMENPSLHRLLHFHFLAAGYLFSWSIAGPDPAPHRPGMATRLAVLFVAMAAHATLGKVMYAYLLPQGTSFSAGQIREAAQLMYYGGDLAELLLAIALFTAWYRQRERRAFLKGVAINRGRHERHA